MASASNSEQNHDILKSTEQKRDESFLAQPSGACCLSGFIHKGEPQGSYSMIADVETYIVHPKPSKTNGHILLYFPDVWGMFSNGLLVMDSFAEAGYLVMGLDYFRGVSEASFSKILL